MGIFTASMQGWLTVDYFRVPNSCNMLDNWIIFPPDCPRAAGVKGEKNEKIRIR